MMKKAAFTLMISSLIAASCSSPDKEDEKVQDSYDSDEVTVVSHLPVSDEKDAITTSVQVLVSPEGKVFISVTGDADESIKDEWGFESIREVIILKALSRYNDRHPMKKVGLTRSDVEKFSKINIFGVPFEDLPTFLRMSQLDQDKVISDMTRKDVGIPINDNKDLTNPNEFQIWMQAIYSSVNENLQAAMRKGEGITVRADAKTPYSTVHEVLDNLQTLKMNGFSSEQD